MSSWLLPLRIIYEWIYENAIPNQVHPSVIGFILSEYSHNGKSEELTEYARYRLFYDT